MKALFVHFSAIATWLSCWFGEQGVPITGPLAVLAAVLLAGFLPKCEHCPTRQQLERELFESIKQRIDSHQHTLSIHFGLAICKAYPYTKTNHHARTST